MDIKNLKGIFSNSTNVIVLITLLILLIGFFKVRKVKLNTKTMTMISMAVALSAVLSMIKIFEMPQGGSVTLGSMLPIFLIAFIYGPEVGMLSGFILGIIQLILGGWVVHPVQLLLDYPLAFMSLGLAGYVKIDTNKTLNKTVIFKIFFAVLIGILGRFVCHYLSGIVFFTDYAKKAGQSPYLYSLYYNISYLSVELIISSIILSILPIKTFKSIATKSQRV